MSGLDAWLAGLGGPGALGLAVALLLGLRHASDPDHLTAVSTLLLSDERAGARRAGLLGLSWGLGHAVTLFAFGVPVILFRRHLPPVVQRGAEFVIGLVILGLAVRLLLRWRRGYFHSHSHQHGDLQHAHPHVHEDPLTGHPPAVHTRVPHAHPHAEQLGRSPIEAFGLGLVHGVGGSAAVGILLVGAVPGRGAGVAALALFAAATAASMAMVSSALGYALARGDLARRFEPLVPLFATASLLFGAWYAATALLPAAV
jgi:ABC-type nickel/cobalt efflux system permease component RcnA